MSARTKITNWFSNNKHEFKLAAVHGLSPVLGGTFSGLICYSALKPVATIWNETDGQIEKIAFETAKGTTMLLGGVSLLVYSLAYDSAIKLRFGVSVWALGMAYAYKRSHR